jgi:hypothetical protein
MAINRELKEVIQDDNYTEAEITGAGLPTPVVGETFIATDTVKVIHRVDDSGVVEDDYISIENQDISGLKPLWKGFCEPNNVQPTINNATRTYGIEAISGGIVSFFCKGVRFDIPNGDSRLEVVLPALSQVNVLYFNDSGQYSFEVTENSDSIRQNNTLGEEIKIQDDGAGGWEEIASISRWDNCKANEIENYASDKTKILQATKNQVTFAGTLNGSTVTHTGGAYFTAVDHEFNVTAQNPKTWAAFYLSGLDAAGKNDIFRAPFQVGLSIPYYSTGGALQYSDISGPSPVLTPVSNGKFVISHLQLADGYLAKVTSSIGVAEYTNLSSAQAALESERALIRGSQDIYARVQILASCIFKNNAGVGELQAVDGAGNLFDYVQVGEVSVTNPSATTPSWDDTLAQNPTGQRFAYINKTAAEIAAEPITAVVNRDSLDTKVNVGVNQIGVGDASGNSVGSEALT